MRKFPQFIFKLLVGLVCLGSIACGSKFNGAGDAENKSVEVKTAQLPILNPPVNGDPFILQVLSEQFDGSELVLTVGFASFEDVDYRGVVIRLQTQKDGEVIQTKEFVVADLFDSYVSFGSTNAKLEKTFQYKFGLSIPAIQGSEYQLELLWGKEAMPYIKAKPTLADTKVEGSNLESDMTALDDNSGISKSTPNSASVGSKNVPYPESANLELQGLRISKKKYCHQKQECEIEFEISAEILNLTDQPVTEAFLAVGFLDNQSEPYKYGVRIPEEEELVELPNFSLQGRNSQAIKLVLDQRVPESMDQRYLPVLRLVAWKN